MEIPSSYEKKMIEEEPLLDNPNPKGGFRTMPFIIANEAFERVASFGLGPNMIVYLMSQYHMEMATGSTVLYIWSAATNFLPILGAFVADSYVGRFQMIGYGSVASLLGMTLLWLTAVVPEARPPSCDQLTNSCKVPSTCQLAFLYCAYAFMAVGAGGIRGSSLAFGADQLLKPNSRNDASALESYFSWYYASTAMSVIIAMTCIVYIQDNIGWAIGFGVPAMLMFFSAVAFFLATPFYVKLKPKMSFLTGFLQVIVASYRNRHLLIPSKSSGIMYHHKKGSTLIVPSEKLRFLNKACVVIKPEQDLTPDGKASNPWSLCTVDQVEELKSLIKVAPLWSTGIMISVTINQNSFPVLQAASMNRHITSNFEIPAGSFGLFLVISATLWIALYDRVILPLASKIAGKPVHLTTIQRMGIGLLLSFVSMIITAIVESFRRATAIKKGNSDDMSAMWLVPQHCLSGLAEAFNAIGQNEFYFSEFPRSMSSIASTLLMVGMSAASLVASSILNAVDDITTRGGNESWVSSDINKGHFDYYYWLLAGLSLVNIIYFFVCCKSYGPCKGELSCFLDEVNDTGDE